MDVTAVREAIHAQPFRPFTLRLADGRELLIPHPDFVAVSARRVAVIRRKMNRLPSLNRC